MRDSGGGGKPTDAWTPVDGDGIKVDITGLTGFVEALGKEMKDQFEVNLKQGIEPMLRVRAPFGGGTLKEGQFFQQMHIRDLQAVGELLKEATLGLAAINSAAFAIAMDYLGSDALSSATVEDVTKAFHPGDGVKSLQSQIAANNPDSDPTAATLTDLSDANIPTSSPPDFEVPVDPAAGVDPYNPDAKVVVGDGTGQYVIPEDTDHPHDTPDDPGR